MLQQLTRSNSEGRETNLSAEGNWHHFINRDSEFGVSFNIRYIDRKDESWTDRSIIPLSGYAATDTVGGDLPLASSLPVLADSLAQHAHSPSKTFSVGADAYFKRWLTKRWLLDASYRINYNRKKNHQDFEANGIADPANSFRDLNHNTQHNLSLKSTIDLSPVKIMPELKARWIHEKQIYQRGLLDTTATRRRLVFDPQVRITWKVTKTIGFELKYNLSTSQPSLLSTLAYRDQTNPLYINVGNPALKDTHTNDLSLDFNTVLSKQQLSLSASVGYIFSDRNTMNALTYQPSTGIYTSRPENVKGSRRWFFNLNYDQGLGDVIRLQNILKLSQEHSYAFLTQIIGADAADTDAGVPSLNRQTQFYTVENLTVGMDWTWLKVSAFAEITANRLRYSDAVGQNTTQWNNRFGVNGEVMLGHFVIKTQLYERMYSGYSIAEMNRNMFIWDASVTWKFLKNKAKLTLELDDILNKKDYKWSSQTAYQQTTSWSDFHHHYSSLTFTYHLDVKVKE